MQVAGEAEMKVCPGSNGIFVRPDTVFEEEYLRDHFALKLDREVYFNPDTAVLEIRAFVLPEDADE